MTLLGYLFGNGGTTRKRTPKGFRVDIDPEAGYDKGSVLADLYVGTQHIGRFIAGKIKSQRRLQVAHAFVLPDWERRGLGTKGYEALASWACANNFVLTSDQARTDASEGFWKKQLTKGRAEYDSESRKYRLTSCAGDLGRLSSVKTSKHGKRP